MKIEIKGLELKDFDRYKELNALGREWRKWDGPYFKEETEIEWQEKMEKLKKDIAEGKEVRRKFIYVDGEVVGSVNGYWKSRETNWYEVGISIMDEKYWNRGIGSKAFKLWIDKNFEENKDLIRIGYTTWSGNKGMMKIGEKLGMIKEACYRKARIVDGRYYDSVSYGILRDEWKKGESIYSMVKGMIK